MPIGDKDMNGNLLRLGGWKANVWQTPYNRFRVAIKNELDKFTACETEKEAIKLYNDLNNTKLKELPKLPSQLLPGKPPSEVPLPIGAHILGKFESKSRLGMGVFNYTIQYPSGEITCTCAGFGYRHYCWHTDMIKDILNQGIAIDKPIVIKYT